MNNSLCKSPILILDFGSQYTQLIARRIRELGVYCEIFSHDVAEETIINFKPAGIILSGGPESVLSKDAPLISEFVLKSSCPILGICYGMQAIANQLGGRVESLSDREYGHANLKLTAPSTLFESVSESINVWMSHGDHVITLPDDYKTLASSGNTPIAAFANEKSQRYGIQFHPEVTHTDFGETILKNFIFTICRCEPEWVTENIVADLVQHIRDTVGEDKVILGLSGGVDSSVMAALLHRAIGSNLTCIFVNNGLLRLNEAEQVIQTFDENMHINLRYVDASEQFLSALAGVSDPEDKRKVIGNVFIDVFHQESEKIDNAKWLAQGTIYPDVIESAAASTGKAHVIKSHHNVGGLPEDMRLNLLEPLRALFKDEVRKIGLSLGLPAEMVFRHPFPGPGLGVRVLGEVKKEYLSSLQLADNIFIELLRKYDYYDKVSQAFAVFLPVKSVGVVGDARCYDYVISLRAVETIDFMTARWADLPYELLSEAAHRIVNEVTGISRVTYDITGKPPATIEWE